MTPTMPLVIGDWKNENDYIFPENHSFIKWAWEFLRRNDEYQRDWFDELPEFLEQKKKFYQKHPDVHNGYYGWSQYDEKHPAFFISSELLLKKWGLHSAPDPRNSILEKGAIYFENTFPRMLVGKNHPFVGTGKPLDAPDDIVPEGEVAFIVDFEAPLKYQLESIEEYVNSIRRLAGEKKYKERAQNIDRVRWPQYLRAYDAFMAKAKHTEAASILVKEAKGESPEKAYKDRLDRAKEWVTNGHRRIVWGK